MIIVLVIVLIAVVAVFSAQNSALVSLSFLSWHFESSLALVVLLALLAGMLVGMVFMWWAGMRRASKERKEAKPRGPENNKPR